ncbi:hypothetical protein LJC68_09980 [Bacteroidales bacterium OttesenSCG-928-B11]|nr:hypothetical protein [Bacteroidales bacterium OttesenSCG-928-E04]MDL2313188.1 hypothetical protein [Bacteroidales bacterium OttesenSCG-928-B11]
MNILSYSYDIGGLGCWLSVDPLASKYPHSSPYVYCNNNPIMLVDPNGMEWYVVDDMGNVTQVERDASKDTEDVLIFAHGGENAAKQIGEKGNYDDYSTTKTFGKGDLNFTKTTDDGGGTYTAMVGKDQAAEDLFNFLADNTLVEWSAFAIPGVGDGPSLNVIATSHKNDQESVGASWALRAATHSPTGISFFKHSHPRCNPFDLFNPLSQPTSQASGKDNKHKNDILKVCPGIDFTIRFKRENHPY